VKYSGDEADLVKTKTLAPQELSSLVSLLDDTKMSLLKAKYGLMYTVIDSWMEWDIALPRGRSTQTLEILNFSPSDARQNKTPYPDSLVKLGCSILKVRSEVYGADSDDSLYVDAKVDCKRAWGIQ